MKGKDFIPQLVLGYYKGQPAVVSDPNFEPSFSTPLVTAAWMIAILEAMERSLPDSEQLAFEEEVTSAYKKLLEDRYERVATLKLKK